MLAARVSHSFVDFTGSLFDAVTRSERAIKATGVKSLIVSNGMLFLIAGLIVKTSKLNTRVRFASPARSFSMVRAVKKFSF